MATPTINRDEVMVINIIKLIASNNGCIPLDHIQLHVQKWIQVNPRDNSLPNISAIIHKYKHVLDRKRGRGGDIVTVKNDINICKMHWSRQGCKNVTCDEIHICKFFLKNSCKKAICPFGHLFLANHNISVLETEHYLKYLSENELSALFKYQMEANEQENRQNRRLEVCKFYNDPSKTCKFPSGKGCPALHLCFYYLRGTCRYGSKCKNSHNLFDEQPEFILKRYGINRQIGYQRAYQCVIDLFCGDDEYDSDVSDYGTSESDEDFLYTFERKIPNICGHYNRGKCMFDKKCRDLHICDNYIKSSCKFGQKCKYSHDVFSEPNKKIFETSGWDTGKSPEEVLVEFRQSVNKTSDISENEADTNFVPSICIYNLRGKCNYKDNCRNKHSTAHYCWQFLYCNDTGNLVWKDFEQDSQIVIENYYEDVQSDGCNVNMLGSGIIQIDFDSMTYSSDILRAKAVRRLGTSSWGDTPTNKSFVTKWLWFWRDDKFKWMEYGKQSSNPSTADLNSCAIEEKFLDKEVTEISFKAGRFDYKLKFAGKDTKGKDMVQENIQIGTKRPVRRRPAKMDNKTKTQDITYSEVAFPKHWTVEAASSDASYQIVEVSQLSSEYKEIEQLFLQTMHPYKVKKLRRIQNYELWEQYSRKREKMVRKLNQSNLNEKFLFHGTNSKFTEAISQQGFDWRLTGLSSGTAYGKGSYFARDASYSSRYCDKKTMFVVKVIAGDYTAGKNEIVRPPPKDKSKPLENFYDSCVNDTQNPTIYVIFDNAQSYPAYILDFEK